MSFVFPDPPRSFAGKRAIKIVLRGAHVLCAGVLTGSHLLEAAPDQQSAWLWATVISGAAIVLLDLYESGAFLLQVRGLVILLKLILVALVPHLGVATGPALAAVVVVSVVSSHAPSKVRYRVVLGGGRIRGGQSRG